MCECKADIIRQDWPAGRLWCGAQMPPPDKDAKADFKTSIMTAIIRRIKDDDMKLWGLARSWQEHYTG
jgi:hypothetical protein